MPKFLCGKVESVVSSGRCCLAQCPASILSLSLSSCFPIVSHNRRAIVRYSRVRHLGISLGITLGIGPDQRRRHQAAAQAQLCFRNKEAKPLSNGDQGGLMKPQYIRSWTAPFPCVQSRSTTLKRHMTCCILRYDRADTPIIIIQPSICRP